MMLMTGDIRMIELETKIQTTLYTPNGIPGKWRLIEIRDQGIEEIKRIASHKNLLPKKWSLLDKVLRLNEIKWMIGEC